MKKISFLCALIISLTQLSCNDTNPLVPYSKNGVISIAGKLNNWTYGGNYKILMINNPGYWNNGDSIYSSSVILEDGSFALNNIKDATSKNMLNPPYPRFVDEAKVSNASFYCSDSSALVTFASLIIIDSKDSTKQLKSFVYRRNFNNAYYYFDDSVKIGDFNTEFIYINNDVEMKGVIEVDYLDETWQKHRLYTYFYNISYIKGWNRIVTYIESNEVSTENNYVKIERKHLITNNEYMGGRWDCSF